MVQTIDKTMVNPPSGPLLFFWLFVFVFVVKNKTRVALDKSEHQEGRTTILHESLQVPQTETLT